MEGNTRGNIVHRAEKKADNTAEEETKKENRKKKKEERRRINSIFFFSAPCIPHPPCGPRGLRTCQLTSAHMFLLLHDRLRRKYRKTVSVCAFGRGQGGKKRGWSNADKAAFSNNELHLFVECI